MCNVIGVHFFSTESRHHKFTFFLWLVQVDVEVESRKVEPHLRIPNMQMMRRNPKIGFTSRHPYIGNEDGPDESSSSIYINLPPINPTIPTPIEIVVSELIRGAGNSRRFSPYT